MGFMSYDILSDSVELADRRTVTLMERHYFNDDQKIIEYATIDENGNTDYWVATKDPEKLSREERHRVLNYSLSSFDDDEIVNYLDLFLQGEFIEPAK